MLTNWDYRVVQDFSALEQIWQNNGAEDQDTDRCRELGDILRHQLGLPIVDMDADESRFFKHHYKSQFVNKGPMVRE